MRATTPFLSAFEDAHLAFSSIIEDHRYSEGRSVVSEQSDVRVELMVLCWLTLPAFCENIISKNFFTCFSRMLETHYRSSMVSCDAHVFRNLDITQKKTI